LRRISSPLVVLVVALIEAAPAFAASVAIVRPPNPPPTMMETLVRLRGELTSVGFTVDLVDDPVATDAGRASRANLEKLGAQRGVDAVVAIVGNVAPDAVEVWVVDRVTGKSVVRRVPFEPRSERAPKTLAIRAIELLRSSFLEIELTATGERNANAAPPPPAVVHFVESEMLASRPERIGVEAGGAALMSLDDVGPALLPLLRFDWAAHPSLIAQLTAAGLGTRATVTTQEGTASIAHAYVVLGATYRFRRGKRLQPLVALGAGALHTSVDGQPESTNRGLNDAQWSLLLDAGLGLSIRVRQRFHLTVMAHAQMAEPYLAIRVLERVVATSARPNLLVTLTLGAWL
jgi:hypothetical protein